MNKPVSTLPALAGAVLAMGLLAGCSFPMPYLRPDLPMPDQWTQNGSLGTAGAATKNLPWPSFVTEPTLRTLVQQALDNNRDLRVAVLQMEQARAQHQIRQAALSPTVNLGASGERRASGAGEAVSAAYTAGLVVNTWEVDFFGRLASLKEAAWADYLATEEARHNAQMTLVAAVTSGWLSWQGSERQLALTRQTLSSREDALRLTRLRHAQGVADALVLRQAETLVESARATLAQQERQHALNRNALALLVGRSLDRKLDDAELQVTGPAFNAVAEVPVGLPSTVLLARPDVRAAELRLQAAHARIEAARAAFFPNISLTAGVGMASSELSGLFKAGATGWLFAPQVLLPIFDGGARQAGLDVAQTEQGLALALYEKAIQTAFREVNDALAGLATLQQQLRALEALVQAETERLRLTDMRVQQGVSSQLELLDAQRGLFAAQQALLQVQEARAQNRVALYRALGGGWQPATP